MSHVVTVPELLDGHTVLDIECLETAGPGLPARGSRFTGRAWLQRFPPRPVPDTGPAAELGRAAVQDLLLRPPFALGNPASQAGRKAGLSRILDWLEQQPCGSWQDRWIASGAVSG